VVRRRTVPVQPEAWDEPIYGEPGVLRTDGDRAECHICGGWYKLLGGHVFQAHGLYADTYRLLFGLRMRTGLAGEALRAQRRASSGHLAEFRDPRFLLSLTFEERSANSRRRVLALESRLDTRNRAKWQRNIAKAASAHATLRQDPAYRARWAAQISEARGGRVARTCPICGRTFKLTRSDAQVTRRTCSRRECKSELRRQIARQIRARGEVRTRLSVAVRRRTGWPERERLQQVPASNWEALAERDAELLRAFYGLPRERAKEDTSYPTTLVDLARAVGLPTWQLRGRLARSLEQLLGKPVTSLRPRGSSTCLICGRPIMRSLHGDLRTTCGAGCLRALRAQHARRTVLSPESQRKAATAARLRVATPEQREAWRAHIRTARRQARPLVPELHAIDPTKFDALASTERDALARYYGLDGQVSRTLNQVAHELRFSKFRAAQLVCGAVAQLLGPESVPTELGGRVTVACAICGAPIELSPSLARSAPNHTCGPECRAELARQRMKRKGIQDDPAIHERARQRIMLRKGRPHADAIRALAPTALDNLSEPRRSLLRAYYGLDGTPVCSYRELGERFGLSSSRASELVRDGVRRVSGPEHA